MGTEMGLPTGRAHPLADALIVVDLQRAFVTGPDAVPEAGALLDAVSVLLDRARTAGALVVHLQNDGPPGAVDEPGTPGWPLALRPEPDDTVVRKVSDDGFAGTELGHLLAAHGVQAVAICGTQSEMCVGATARTALASGLRVVLPHDAHGTYDIPAVDGLAEGVPAAMVSRVAEWALGDAVDIVARAAEVEFRAAARRPGRP